MLIRQIVERRAAIRQEMNALHAGATDGVLSADAQTKWDANRADLTTLEAQESRQSMIDDMDRRSTGESLDGGRGGLDALRAGVGLLDAIRAGLGGTDAASGRAREVSQELERRSGRKAQGIFWDMRAAQTEQRVVTTGLPAGGPGANIIGTDYRPELFVDRLRNATRIRQLGATVLSDLQGPVSIPRRKASVVAAWTAENTAFPNSDPQFDQVTLNLKSCGVITEFSRNMIMQASPDVQTLAQNDMSLILAEALDQAAIAGTGGVQPIGILSTVGIGNVAIGANGSALNYANIADLIGQVEDANGTGASMAFLSNTKVKRAVAKMTDLQNRPLGAGVVFQGLPVAYTNLVPATGTKGTGTGLSSLIYGNWSDLMLGFWSELDILVNPYESTAYARGGVQIRAVMSVDVAVRHAASFAAITDIVA